MGNDRGTDLIKECQCTILLCQVTDFRNRPNTSAHGVNTLKRNDFRRLLRVFGEFQLKILQVVVLENLSLRTRMSHALDHGRVIHVV